MVKLFRLPCLPAPVPSPQIGQFFKPSGCELRLSVNTLREGRDEYVYTTTGQTRDASCVTTGSSNTRGAT
eukprot:5991285-Prymnesium_polylepis.1